MRIKEKRGRYQKREKQKTKIYQKYVYRGDTKIKK